MQTAPRNTSELIKHDKRVALRAQVIGRELEEALQRERRRADPEATEIEAIQLRVSLHLNARRA